MEGQNQIKVRTVSLAYAPINPVHMVKMFSMLDRAREKIMSLYGEFIECNVEPSSVPECCGASPSFDVVFKEKKPQRNLWEAVEKYASMAGEPYQGLDRHGLILKAGFKEEVYSAEL